MVALQQSLAAAVERPASSRMAASARPHRSSCRLLAALEAARQGVLAALVPRVDVSPSAWLALAPCFSFHPAVGRAASEPALTPERVRSCQTGHWASCSSMAAGRAELVFLPAPAEWLPDSR
jgi:hypothetical protein